MDEAARQRARKRAGVVVRGDLGSQPRRAAVRAGLVRLQPGAFLAGTQPVDVAAQLAVVTEVWGDRDVYVIGAGALWLHGAGVRPAHLRLGIPATHELATTAAVTVRRLAPSVLKGARTRQGVHVVALEIALIQHVEDLPYEEVLSTLEELVRSRRTTLNKLRSRCRRGLKGSAAVRRACDELSGGSMDADVRRLHAALVARGVEGLELEVHFTTPDGGSAYADLMHHPSRTALEVDGFLTHTQRAQFRVDRRRDRWMNRYHRVGTLRIDVSEIRSDLDGLADELVELLGLNARDVRERRSS
jgi:hypothetical protein